MSISGLVFLYFSHSSDLFPSQRNIGVQINEKKVPLTHVLDKFFSEKGISPQVRAQYETLVFLTDTNGSPVFYKERDTPELRATALNLKTALVSNYTRVEITLLKISADQQRDRDVAEQVDELLQSIEQRGNDAQIEDHQNMKAIAAHQQFAINQGDETNNNISNNNENNKQQQRADALSSAVQIQQENKRKSFLLARRVPLGLNPNSSLSSSSNVMCVLCNFPIRKNPSLTSTSSKKFSTCPNPKSNGRCTSVCCDGCFEFAYKVKMMGMSCPICGGDGRNDDTNSSSETTAVGGNNNNRGDGFLETKTANKVRRVEAE